MKKIISILSLLSLMFVPSVHAIDIPEFPHCSNTGGQIIAKYESGIHGVPGNPTTFSGRDTVYRLDDTRTVQCLCLEDNTGIQTNWWKVSSISQEEIDTLKKLDWIFIPNGTSWGLSDSAYFAKNSNFSCGSNSNGQILSSSTSINNGVGGSVLGLAATGGSIELIGFASLGIAILTAGIILKKRASND